MSQTNRQLKLIAYADGIPSRANFGLVESPQREPADGEFVVHTRYLSMDPAPRMRMSGATGGMPQIPLGSVMIGRGVGIVIASCHPDFAEGDVVAGELGWQDFALSRGEGVRKVNPALGPIQSSLGILGPSGLAAYFSTLRLGQPKAGETFVIDAAAGSVASLAGQIARLQGARTVGIAGGAAQIGFVRDELGFDATVDYLAAGDDLSAAIGGACPGGIDVFADLVGGTIHDAAMRHLNVGARIVLIGTIANYNLGAGEVDRGPRHLLTWINKRARLSGFIVGDYVAEWPGALTELAGWLRAGKLKYRETIFDELVSAPDAFAALFGSDHVGKLLVRLE